LKLDSWQIR